METISTWSLVETKNAFRRPGEKFLKGINHAWSYGLTHDNFLLLIYLFLFFFPRVTSAARSRCGFLLSCPFATSKFLELGNRLTSLKTGFHQFVCSRRAKEIIIIITMKTRHCGVWLFFHPLRNLHEKEFSFQLR